MKSMVIDAPIAPATEVYKILELTTQKPQAQQLLQIEKADVSFWDFAAPIAQEMMGAYDIVFANNVLQRISYTTALDALRAWSQCLRPGGELHVIVPSLEWACREVLHERPSPICMVALFGGQGGDGSVHLSGFTMRLLRANFEKIGLSVTRARTAPVTMGMNGTQHEIEHHYISGVKGMPELRRA